MRAADSRPCKGDRSLIPYPSRATARAAPAALRKPCLKSGGRVLNLSLLFAGAGPRPARGRTLCAPTVETGPGTLVRKRQAQKHNRTNSNFLPAQAPSGAGRDRTQALLILRAGTVLPASRGNPRKMGSGESGPMDLGGAKRSRSPSAASPVAFCLLFRHGKRRSPPAGGEISHAQRTQSEPCPPSSSPFGAIHLEDRRGRGRWTTAPLRSA